MSALEIDEAAKRISTLQSTKQRLLQELSKVNLQLCHENARYNTLLNEHIPVAKLPFELLSHIFIRCQVASPPKLYYCFAVAVSHVCRHWRTVSLSTPLLWNKIAWKIESPSSFNRLEVHLIRSNDCYLDVHIYTPLPDIQHIMKLISAHSNRLRRFSLQTKHGESTIQACLGSSTAPLLEFLSLEVDESEEKSPRSKYPGVCPVIFSGGTPTLTFVRFGHLISGHLRTPSRAITTLDLGIIGRYYMEPYQFVALLSELPSLVNLALGQLHIRHPRDPFDTTKQMELPQLRSLRISGPSTSPHLVLSLITVSRLDSLFLSNLESFHAPNLPSIRDLVIDHCSFDADAARNILLSLPSVIKVTLNPICPSICSAMVISGDMANDLIPWSSLHTLTIQDMGVSDVPLLRIMTSTRSGCNHAIKKLRADRRTRGALRKKLCLDWFKEQMTLENCEVVEEWAELSAGYDHAR